MKERYFVKNLAAFLIPMLLPLIILGSLSFLTTQRDMKRDINQSSQYLLLQSQRQLELILGELDSLKLALFQNPKVFNELSTILQQPTYTYESSTSYQIIYSYLNALTSGKPYIHSVYFYVDNPLQRYISSLGGLLTPRESRDMAWFEAFMSPPPGSEEWTVRREVKLYEFETEPTSFVTIYQALVPRQIGIVMNIRPDYMETFLGDVTTYEGQKILVLSEDNQILFANDPSGQPTGELLERIVADESTFFDLETSKGLVNVTKISSDRHNWKYVSIIPHTSLYEAPSRILSYTLLFSGLALLSGLALTYYLTRRNYRQLLNITRLLRQAENNRVALKRPSKVKDEYSYIIENMVAHFIEHRYIRTQLSEEKYRLQVMEMQALQAQINPHFLYNTMNSIYWETVALTGKTNRASDMIEDLSDLLSYSFSQPSATVTWSEEIANTVSYVNIQKKRFKDKFTLILEYDEEIKLLKTMKLLLQPLVENSIYHGFREMEAGGLVKIKLEQRVAGIHLHVIDNGCGMSAQRLNEVRQSLTPDGEKAAIPSSDSEHIGLRNTYRRLRLSCEGSTMRIRSKPGLGTVISIEIPNPL
ncbi:sensor histidine kinase [Paenibacillus daejeonensis]|uniref:sensor histidine kinase n=1 Tax=Paenibacillus daejeonensis TaxID=135193 RepID=UPI0003789BB7|nr:histidine kinase [Paenibacillus daejeonensis]